MPRVDVCPKCGALITPQLARCRQCKTYLHGTKLEGFIFENLLPGALAASPGTGIIFLFVVLYYALMGLLAGPSALLAMSGYNLSVLGSTVPSAIFQGQYWRFFTSMFGHHDMVHIAFNLYALTIVGPRVEELYDRKKMMIIYFVGGAFSMIISYIVHVEWGGSIGGGSIGASGAVSALMGATLFGAVRLGPEGAQVKSMMIRWSIYMVVFGLVMSGVDNAAHVGGFLTGAAFAFVMPLGGTRTVVAQKLLSVAMLGLIGLVGVSTAMMIQSARGYPISIDDDAYGRSVLFFSVEEGTEWKYSGQKRASDECVYHLRRGDLGDQARYDCEVAARAITYEPLFLRALAEMAQKSGDTERAGRLRYAALRLERRL